MDYGEYLQSPAKRVQTDRMDRTIDHLLKWASGTQRTVSALIIFGVAQLVMDVAVIAYLVFTGVG